MRSLFIYSQLPRLENHAHRGGLTTRMQSTISSTVMKCQPTCQQQQLVCFFKLGAKTRCFPAAESCLRVVRNSFVQQSLEKGGKPTRAENSVASDLRSLSEIWKYSVGFSGQSEKKKKSSACMM